MISGIYDIRGKLIPGSIERVSSNEPVSNQTEVGEANVAGVGNPGLAFTRSNYQGNIIMKDNNGVIAVFIGLA